MKVHITAVHAQASTHNDNYNCHALYKDVIHKYSHAYIHNVHTHSQCGFNQHSNYVEYHTISRRYSWATQYFI